jgi:hypothetical protein
LKFLINNFQCAFLAIMITGFFYKGKNTLPPFWERTVYHTFFVLSVTLKAGSNESSV